MPDNIKFKILSAILGIFTGATNQFEISLSKKNKLMQKNSKGEIFLLRSRLTGLRLPAT